MTVEVSAGAANTLPDRFPLSFNQEFLCLFDKGDDEGPFGPRYSIVCGWRVQGPVDVETLRLALADVIDRHEALRTTIVRGADGGYQRVLPARPADLEVRDLPGVPAAERARRAEELLIEYETKPFSVHEPVLLRAILGRFDDEDAVLVCVAHHTAVDEWSMKLVVQDLARCYRARQGDDVAPLPPARQYREYAEWDRQRAESPATGRARKFWREQLRGANIVPTRTDHRRSQQLPKNTAAHRFLIDAELTDGVLRLARETRSSVFMVMVAAYQCFLREITGVNDVTVTTLASGRSDARFQQTVGSFFNLLPLRTDLTGCTSFRDVVARTRRTCLDAYAHEIPFRLLVEEVPDIGASFEGDDTAVLSFQVFQLPFVMTGESVGDLVFHDIRRRLLSQPVTTDIPDGGLWTLDIDPAGDMVCSLWFNTNLFEERTIRALVEDFRRVLQRLVEGSSAPLAAS